MPQPPFQFTLEPGQDDDQDQVHRRRAQVGVGHAVSLRAHGLGRIQQLLAADDGDEGGVFEEGNKLIAQGRQNGLKRLGNDDEAHGLEVVQTQRAPRLRLAGVQGHQAAPDDLSDISAGVDAQGDGADDGEVPAAGEDDAAHDEHLDDHRRAADDGGVDGPDGVEQEQDGVVAAGPLLVMGRADDGDDHTQDNAHDEG